jgi:ribosomal protein S18 acetylase RimI-like enzyme
MLDSTDLPRRAAAHLDLAWREMTRDRGAVQTPTFLRVITGEAHPLGNVAIVNDSSDPAVAAAAAQALVDAAVPAAVIYTVDVPAAAEQYLAAAGFARAEPIPAMVVGIDELPAVDLPPSCEWLRVGPEEAAEFTQVLAAGFEMPLGLARRFSPQTLGIDPTPSAPTQYFAVRAQGRLVATAVLFLADALAGIYSVATLPAFRRRGLGAYATAQALRSAATLGYRVGVLQSSQAGYAVYRGLGFREVGQLPMFIRTVA